MHQPLSQWLIISTYWITLAAICCSLMLILTLNIRPMGSLFYRQGCRVTVVAIILVAITRISVTPQYQVLADESNLMSTSVQLAKRHAFENVYEGWNPYYEFIPLNAIVPKRPPLYATLVSIAHSLLGIHTTNLFLVNNIVLFLILWLTGLWVLSWSSLPIAMATQILITSHPIVTLNAQGGGFDLLNLLAFISIIIAATYHINHQTPQSLHLVIAATTMASLTRYESIVYGPITIMFLIMTKQIKIQHIKPIRLHLIGWLILLSPAIVQKIVSIGTYENWDKPLFHWQYILPNATSILKNFWRLDFTIPFNTIALSIGLIATPLAIYKAKRNKIIALASLLTLTNIIIIWTHIAGDLTHPTQARYYIIFSWSLVVALAYWLTQTKIIRNKKCTPLYAIILLILYHPIATENNFHNSLILTREINLQLKFIEQRKSQGLKDLVISTHANILAASQIPAVTFDYVQKNAELVRQTLKMHNFHHILVVAHQYQSQPTNKAGNYAEVLPKKWKIKPLQKWRTNHDTTLLVAELQLP